MMMNSVDLAEIKSLRDEGIRLWADGTGFRKVPSTIINQFGCAINDRLLLETVYFLEFVAPNMWLPFVDGEIEEYFLEMNTKRWLKIGETREDWLILYNLKAGIYCYDEIKQSFYLLGNNFIEFYQGLVCFAQMVDKATIDNKKAYVENEIDPTFLREVRIQLECINPKIICKGSYWNYSISRLNG